MDIINKLSAILATEIKSETDESVCDTKEINRDELIASFRQIVESHNGKWLYDIGDTNLALFEHPSDAVNCALASFTKIKNQNLSVTSSIHLGDIKAISNDIFGNSVNITLSMLQATPKNTIYISEMFFGSICYNKAYKTKLVGIKKLKGIQHSTTLFELFDNQSNHHNEDEISISDEHLTETKHVNRKTELSFLVALSFIFVYIFHTYYAKTANEKEHAQIRLEILPYNHVVSSLNANAIRSIIVDNLKEQNQLTVLVRDKNGLTNKSKKKTPTLNTKNFYSLTIEVQENEHQFYIQLTLIEPNEAEPVLVEKLTTNLSNLPKSLNISLQPIYRAMNLNETKEISGQFTANNLDLIGRYHSADTAIDTVTEKFTPLQSNLIDIEIRLQHCLFLARKIHNKEIGSTLTANNCSFEIANNLSSQQQLKLASFYYLTNEISLANDLANAVLSVNKLNYDAMLLKANIAITLQRYVEAKALLDKLSPLFSNNYQVTQTLATLYLYLNQKELAEQQVDEALRLSNDQIDTILDFIPVYKETGYISEAILLVESLVNQLNSSHLLFELAELQFLNNDLLKTKDNLNKALKLSPSQATYHSLLGETYYFLRDKTNAAYHYNEAIRLFVQKGNKSLAQDNALLALSYARIDKPFKAEDMIKLALKQANNSPEINYLAALIFHHMDKKDIANIYLEHAHVLGLKVQKYDNSPSWRKLAKIGL